MKLLSPTEITIVELQNPPTKPLELRNLVPALFMTAQQVPRLAPHFMLMGRLDDWY